MCPQTKEEYNSLGINIVENQDGTVSLFNSDGKNVTVELNNKSCCEAIGYQFDITNQKCLWKKLETTRNDEFKIVLNPDGNHGTLFGVNENEDCCLDISFDYMFKFDCGDLIDSVTESTIVTDVVSQAEISELEAQLAENSKLIEYYQNLIDELNNIPYVIECNETSGEVSEVERGIELYQKNEVSSAYTNKETGNNVG